MIKPKALVFAHPFEGRTGYFLAGLSHFYELEIHYTTNKRFRFTWQVFYKWQYSPDAKFVPVKELEDVIGIKGKFDAAFVFQEAFDTFLFWRDNQDGILDVLKKIKNKVKDLYWLEIGEQQWFTFGRPEFWDMVSGVVKGQVFKKQYSHLLKNLEKISLFQDPKLLKHAKLVQENISFNFDKYSHKILPLPFTPTITDLAKYKWQDRPRVYDWAANTRTVGNGLLRCAVIESLEKNIDGKYSHSIEYHNTRHASNITADKKFFDVYLLPKVGKYLFKLKYGKYFYAQPLYLHNLLNAKCYLGLGWSFSSLRTADAWGAGTVLVNFSFEKCDYGLPVEDGYNYVSIGERDEMTTDNEHFKPEYERKVADAVENILGNPQKQKEIVKNQLKTYNEYFTTPEQFVKKIFIEKIK